MTQIDELLRQSYALEYGPEKVALLEEAVRQADLLQDEKMGYTARKALVETATFSGEGEKALPAFAWCLHYLDTHPTELSPYEARSLAWRHKWMINTALALPQIPWARVQDLHADFARRAQALGGASATVAFYRLVLAMNKGDKAAAQQAFDEWNAERRDPLSDCSACESQRRADFYRFMGDDMACLRQTATMLERRESCSHIPHSTYARALEVLARRGQWSLADEYARKGRRMVAGKPDFLSQQADHLAYLALTDGAAALKWYARHLHWAEASKELSNVGDFHDAAALLFTVLQGGRTTRKLNLPPTVHGYQENGVYSVSERLNYHLAEARRIAALFDTRNGTPYHTQQLEQTLALAQLAGRKDESRNV